MSGKKVESEVPKKETRTVEVTSRIVDLNALAAEIVNNRKRRNNPSATDLSETTLGMVEELGAFETARRKHEAALKVPPGADPDSSEIDSARHAQAECLTYLMLYCLGAFHMIGEDADNWLAETVPKVMNKPPLGG